MAEITTAPGRESAQPEGAVTDGAPAWDLDPKGS